MFVLKTKRGASLQCGESPSSQKWDAILADEQRGIYLDCFINPSTFELYGQKQPGQFTDRILLVLRSLKRSLKQMARAGSDFSYTFGSSNCLKLFWVKRRKKLVVTRADIAECRTLLRQLYAVTKKCFHKMVSCDAILQIILTLFLTPVSRIPSILWLPTRIFCKNKLYKNTQAEICPNVKNKLRTITRLKFWSEKFKKFI